MAEHRVSMLRSSLRRHADPAASRDPRVREIVAQLADLEQAPDPDPRFRAELREQLVAIAPRLVAEGDVVGSGLGADTAGAAAVAERATAQQPTGARSGSKGPRHAVPRRITAIARPLRIATAAAAVLALLLGGAFWMSRDTLPGDNLYGLKRAGERIELSLAGSDRDRAADRLEFARTRVEEVKALWTQAKSSALGRGPLADAGVSDHTAALITDTLASADSDLTAAAGLLNADAVHRHSSSPLRQLTSWAGGQLARLQFIETAMPASRLRNHVVSSGQLVDRAVQRSEQLSRSLDCSCAQDARTDKLGPVPCSTCTTTPSAPATSPPASSTSPVPGPTQRSAGRTASGSRTGGRPGPSAGTASRPVPRSSGPSRSSAPTSSPRPSVKVPATPNLPKVSLGTCVSVPVGPINVGVGDCGSS